MNILAVFTANFVAGSPSQLDFLTVWDSSIAGKVTKTLKAKATTVAEVRARLRGLGIPQSTAGP